MSLLLSTTSSSTKLQLYNHNFIEAISSSRLLNFPGFYKKICKKKAFCVSLSVKCSQSTTQIVNESSQDKSSRKGSWKPLLSEGRDEDENFGVVCPGCGIFMQDSDPGLPGYYQERKMEVVSDVLEEDEGEDDFLSDENGDEIDGSFEGSDEIGDEIDGPFEGSDEIGDEIDGSFEDSDKEAVNVKSKDGIDWDSEEWDSDFDVDDDDAEELDGFTAASVGYGNITEETVEKRKRKRVSKSERKRNAREARRETEEVTVCARCHSLRNYGQVKNQTAENLIPDFDFDRLITTRLMKITSRSADSTVVVMVVDCVDFDGSFPKGAAKSLFKALEGSQDNQKISKKLPKLVLVATKVDLLPSQISPTRLDRWVRHRAKANGAPKLSAVYLVSSRKDLGVRNLLTFIKELAGPRGNVWVIGAQNAGKSTLINAFAKKERVKAIKLTEAAVPGTTLGILRIRGVLSAKAKMYDTPGLLHPYLMSMRLNREEQKMIEIRKELKPRTYRMKVGQTVYVGGLMRLDLSQASVQTIYVSIWASPNVSLHMGKTENANDTWSKHAGVRLQPPISADRVPELGEWKATEVKVSGTSWDVNSIDIAAAGFCWFSLGLKGEATLTLWTFNGVEVTLREPLVLDRARFLERPGFLLPKAISEALSDQNKLEAKTRKSFEEEASLL